MEPRISVWCPSPQINEPKQQSILGMPLMRRRRVRGIPRDDTNVICRYARGMSCVHRTYGIIPQSAATRAARDMIEVGAPPRNANTGGGCQLVFELSLSYTQTNATPHPTLPDSSESRSIAHAQVEQANQGRHVAGRRERGIMLSARYSQGWEGSQLYQVLSARERNRSQRVGGGPGYSRTPFRKHPRGFEPALWGTVMRIVRGMPPGWEGLAMDGRGTGARAAGTEIRVSEDLER
ncbi:hypothetical protein FA13DRAFT_1780452 [Coprinellus micaceus]|uniref:Uncharacterized protein n=1 Tax=Coprinellus micaceus TaxID=71717 RepID=A0A4Y7SDR3_COPMI|nr:hypothetical protein FA13DRAFT_1780452 [Coprinellus micaceus]